MGPATNAWLGALSHSHDSIVKRSGDRFTDLVKRTYRVLEVDIAAFEAAGEKDRSTRRALEQQGRSNWRD